VSDLDYLNLSDGFVTDPGADDFVHADQLAAAVINGCQCWINLIIDRLNIITNEENQLRDDIVRLRNLSSEVLTALGSQWDVMVECRLATTGSVLLSGLPIIDGTLPQDGDIVLVKDQADASTNGPYVASAGLWSRWPGMADGDGVDNVYAWVTEGVENRYTSFVSQGDDRTVGSSDYLFIICHQEFVPNLTADILDALQGTEGSPTNANRFVTDEDPRLDVFTAGQIGVVPDPFGFDCEYFLCADGTWQKPEEVAAEGFMRVDLNNIMDADGEITFPDTVGIHGLADPVDPGDAVNLNYFDTAVTAILATLVGLTDWKQDLDAINGVIGCDGAGNYAEVTDPTFATATITGKLTVGGLIDPTGLQLTQVAGNPGDANTLWVDDGAGDLWFGPGSITGSIGANAAAAAAAQGTADSAQIDATQALADAAAAQGTADAAKAVIDALDAITGFIVCDGAGNYAGKTLPGVANAVLTDDDAGGFGGSAQFTWDGSIIDFNDGTKQRYLTWTGGVLQEVFGTIAPPSLSVVQELTDTLRKFVTGVEITDPTNKGLRLTNANYRDQNYNPLTLGLTTGNNPDRIALNGTTLEIAAFDNTTEEECQATFELDHDWKIGEDLRFHVHWMPVDANAGNVKWNIDYIITRAGVAVGAASTITVTDATPGVAWEPLVSTFPLIDGSSLQVGDQIHTRFYRDAGDAADTYGSDAAVETFGNHLAIDSLGSEAVGTKS